MIESVGWNWNEVTACDISTDGIAHLKKWQKEEGVDIRTVQADMKALPFAEGNFPKIDENSILKTEGAEVNVPHFYVNKEDILRLLPDFEIHSIRHIDDCYHDGKYGKGCHYHISATLKK